MLTKTKIKFITLSFSVLAVTFIQTAIPASAGYYNFGTLDIKPVQNETENNPEWFNNYLLPGQKVQKKIRISNFSDKTKQLYIYSTDSSDNLDQVFTAKKITETSDDIAEWIKLPIKTFSLQPAESKILSVNISAPDNAGVGLHTGAIIVRELNTPLSSGTSEIPVAIEKGIRVYLNIIGPIVTNYSHINAYSSSQATGSTFSLQTKNEGTTDVITKITLTEENLLSGTKQEFFQSKRIKPATIGTTEIIVPKHSFGIYSYLIHENGNILGKTVQIFIPLWSLLIILAISLCFAKPRISISLPSLQQIFNTPSFKRSFAYISVFSITLTSVFGIATMNLSAKAKQIQKTTNTYELTIKWGNFRELFSNPQFTQDWQGSVAISDAAVSIKELLNFETNDTAELTNNSKNINFKTQTGPDNDGIILLVIPTSERTPEITYTNNGQTDHFFITDFLNSAGIVPNGALATYLKSDIRAEHILALSSASNELLEELEATGPVTENITSLDNLFVADLPATPEVLSDFILNSDYVHDIQTESDKTTTITTDSILIEALQGTPEVLADMAATPNLNFMFIPNEPVKFPPQEFSFNTSRETTQNMGTMIFVQNKKTPWNTYISTSNFTSLNGKHTLPASTLTINPGPAEIISEKNDLEIKTGKSKTFRDENDKTVLVNVNPEEKEQILFTLNPVFSLRIPPGTIPGRYRGILTITSL